MVFGGYGKNDVQAGEEEPKHGRMRGNGGHPGGFIAVARPGVQRRVDGEHIRGPQVQLVVVEESAVHAGAH